MRHLTHGSLFAGIGGFDLGFERAGIKTVWQVEIDPFCRKVLEKHWPNVQRYEDVRDCRPPKVDIISGGFPCQPFSHAGKRRGQSDDRFLWPEMARVVAEVRPIFVVGENVSGIIHTALERVLSDLESFGYQCQAFSIPACAVDAPHRRERIWIVAYSNGEGLQGRECGILQKRTGQLTAGESRALPDTDNEGESGLQINAFTWNSHKEHAGQFCRWDAEPNVGRVANGVPNRVDRLRSLGNAIVPQIAEWIGRRIVEASK